MATELTCLLPAPGSEKLRTIVGTAAVPRLGGLLVSALEETLDVGPSDRPAAELDERAAAPRSEARLDPWSLAFAKIMAAMTPPAVTMATAPRAIRPDWRRPLVRVGRTGLAVSTPAGGSGASAGACFSMASAVGPKSRSSGSPVRATSVGG